jgi:hypothetical protein
MYIQYVGLDNSISSRIYTFHVIDPPQETREFTVKVRSDEFCPGRLRFQDGPGISSARLQRELKEETQESRAEADLRIEEQDVREYRAQHYPQQKLPKATDALPGFPPGSSPPNKQFQNRGYWPLGPTQHPVSEEISTALARTRRLSGRAEIGSRSSVCEGVLLAELPGSSASAHGAEPTAPGFHPTQVAGRHLGGRREPCDQGREARERYRRGTPGECRALPANGHRGRV